MQDDVLLLGPYAKFVRDDGVGLIEQNEIPNSIAYDVLRYEDYVRYDDYLLRFVDKFFSELTNTQGDCVRLVGALMTISKLKAGCADSLIKMIANQYDRQIDQVRAMPSELDLDALLNALRLAIERRCSVHKYGLVLTEILESIVAGRKRALVLDAMSVLINHREVLTDLYDGRLNESTTHRLDGAIQAIQHFR